VSVKTPASANPVRDLAGAITFNNQVVEAKKISMNLGKSISLLPSRSETTFP